MSRWGTINFNSVLQPRSPASRRNLLATYHRLPLAFEANPERRTPIKKTSSKAHARRMS